jgi:hypothetical protein
MACVILTWTVRTLVQVGIFSGRFSYRNPNYPTYFRFLTILDLIHYASAKENITTERPNDIILTIYCLWMRI